MIESNQEQVEDAWRETLVLKGDLDPDTAERLITAIQSHHRPGPPRRSGAGPRRGGP
jgi:hypothetical protein